MALVSLLNIPSDPASWSIWGFAHRDQHTLARIAIQSIYQVNLTEYPLDPIDLTDINNFLTWNEQAHDDINAVLGTQSSNLNQTDLSDPAQLQAWIYLHFLEHQNWSSVLHFS